MFSHLTLSANFSIYLGKMCVCPFCLNATVTAGLMMIIICHQISYSTSAKKYTQNVSFMTGGGGGSA